MEALLNVCLGIGLSAACGLRVFVPFLLLSAAARTGHLALAPSFAWIGGDAALLTFAVATVCEIAAYYIPWLDNLLDAVAGPAAVIAGVVATASVVTEIDPYLKWTLAIIAGGGAAGAVQTFTTGTRAVSTLTTGGLGNPLVATLELVGAVLLSLAAILVPVAAVVATALLLTLAASRARRRKAA